MKLLLLALALLLLAYLFRHHADEPLPVIFPDDADWLHEFGSLYERSAAG